MAPSNVARIPIGAIYVSSGAHRIAACNTVQFAVTRCIYLLLKTKIKTILQDSVERIAIHHKKKLHQTVVDFSSIAWGEPGEARSTRILEMCLPFRSQGGGWLSRSWNKQPEYIVKRIYIHTGSLLNVCGITLVGALKLDLNFAFCIQPQSNSCSFM